MRPPQLDERLSAAAALFSACETGADIGADHGRLSCDLLQSGKCARMILTDISADSLIKARRLLSLHGLSDRADFRVGDGLRVLAGDKPGCAAICGMGGRLIASILRDGASYLNGAALVLSSHTEIPLVRGALVDIGYHIVNERIARARGRFYVLLRAEPGAAAYTDKALYIGPMLMRERAPLYLDYLLWRRGVVACEKGHEAQLRWIEEELNA